MTSTTLSKAAAAGVLATAFASAVAYADPVVLNPSFETPAGTQNYGPIDNWAQTPNPSGLSGFPYLSGEQPVTGFAWDNGFVPGEGTTGKIGFVQVYPGVAQLSLEQTVSGFTVGTPYILTYFENSRAALQTPMVEVLVDGVPVVGEHIDTPVAGVGDRTVPFRTETSIPFTVASTSALVEFRVNQETGADDATAMFDDVSIVSAVPEPSTWMAGAGAAVFAAAGFRRKRL